MTGSRDMSELVTRQELHDALEAWGGALRVEISTQGAQLRNEIAQLRTELRTELGLDLARWANTIIETLRAEWRAQAEPTADLPARVTAVEELEPRVARLEARVFAPKRETKRVRPAKRTTRRR